MKLYNRDLEEIENEERYNRIDKILKQQIDFLVETFGIDRKFLQDRAERLAVIEMNPTDSTFFCESNGEKQERKWPSGAAALTARKRQEISGNQWIFETGIYYSDNSSNHTVIHELFHFLSMPEQIEFGDNGIALDKAGVEISGWDREDNLVDRTYEATRFK